MNRIHLSLFCMLSLFGSLFADSEHDMLKHKVYTIEEYLIIDYQYDTAMLDRSDYPVLMKGDLVAVVKFVEDDRQFLIPIARFGDKSNHSKKLQEFVALVHGTQAFPINITPSYWNNRHEPILYRYQLGDSDFEVEDSDYARDASGGIILSQTQFFFSVEVLSSSYSR